MRDVLRPEDARDRERRLLRRRELAQVVEAPAVAQHGFERLEAAVFDHALSRSSALGTSVNPSAAAAACASAAAACASAAVIGVEAASAATPSGPRKRKTASAASSAVAKLQVVIAAAVRHDRMERLVDGQSSGSRF